MIMNGKRKLLAFVFAFLSWGGFAQQQIRLTSNVVYREGESKSWVLDIADPQDIGNKGLRPAVVIIHGGGWSAGSKVDPV